MTGPLNGTKLVMALPILSRDGDSIRYWIAVVDQAERSTDPSRYLIVVTSGLDRSSWDYTYESSANLTDAVSAAHRRARDGAWVAT